MSVTPALRQPSSSNATTLPRPRPRNRRGDYRFEAISPAYLVGSLMGVRELPEGQFDFSKVERSGVRGEIFLKRPDGRKFTYRGEPVVLDRAWTNQEGFVVIKVVDAHDSSWSAYQEVAFSQLIAPEQLPPDIRQPHPRRG